MPYDHHPTLSDTILILETEFGLTDTQRRDMISAIKRFAGFLHRAPEDLPTDAPRLRALADRIHPVQIGISAKSLANVKTALTKALQVSGHLPETDTKVDPCTDWQEFLSHSSGKHQVFALSRFVNFCSNRAITPQDVTDAVMVAFQEYLNARLLGKDPAKLCKEMAQCWNGIISRNDLPLMRLTYQTSSQYRLRSMTHYPVSLQSDIDAYLKRLSHADLFDENGPDKPLRPTSLLNIKAHLSQFLDALVSSGEDPDKFTSLAEVVTSEKMKVAFKAIMARRGTNSVPVGLHNIAATLTAIARHHSNVGPDDLEAILKIKKRISPNPKGMSDKNRERLGQFNDWENVARLMSLPDVLMDRALANPTSRTSALLAMHAVCIAILLSCPMRAKNLAGLDLDRQVIPHRKGTHTFYTLRVEGKEVKNLEHIEVVLNPRNSRLLHSYIMRFRPHVSDVPGTALFPKQGNGEPRDPANLSGDLKGLIYRETGLTVHTHLFRHLSGFLYLQQCPGDFETLRQLLKHKKLQTTMDFYATLSSQWAHDHYDEVVLGKWGGRHD